ncbi:MAG: EF-P beta-lysylation protein EpmB [Halioglobus sp.]
MIPHTDPQWQALPWQQELKEAFRRPIELLDFLGLTHEAVSQHDLAAEAFSLLVPRPFARRMKAGDPNDPLLLQVLSSGAELNDPAGYTEDPLQEANNNPVPGLIHKYHGRVLLIAAAGCAVNCRYCFRRHFDYGANNPSREDWARTLKYVARDSSISEVILSGGDPLLLNDDLLAELIGRIEAIPHVKRLRIHTRLPVVLPARVTPELCATLNQSRLFPVVVIHCNHRNEIDPQMTSALRQLAEAGVSLLNQTVMLAGINDSADTLAALSEALFYAGVTPYYLHLLDRVSGASQFDIPESRALEIYRQLLATSSGYLVPKLVREIPGKPSKTGLLPDG